MKNTLFMSIFAFIVIIAMGQSQFSVSAGTVREEKSTSVIQSTDGGYVVVGSTESYSSGLTDLLVVKFDASGSVSWAKAIGEASYSDGKNIVETNDGGFAVVGTISSSMVLIKLSSTGTVQWMKSVGDMNEQGADLYYTTTGDYILTGLSGSWTESNNFYIVKLSSTGVHQWSSSVGSTDGTEYPRSITETSDGGYVVVGWTTYYGSGSNDMFVVKYTSAGVFSWARAIGGPARDEAFDVVETSDNGLVVLGITYSYSSGLSDAFLTKLTSSGALSWSKTYGTYSWDDTWSILLTSDGGFLTTGYSWIFESDFVLRLSSTGTVEWIKTISDAGDVSSSAKTDAALTTDGGFIVLSATETYSEGSTDLMLVKYNSSDLACSGGDVVISSESRTPTVTTVTPVVNTTPTVVADITPTVTVVTLSSTEICTGLDVVEEEAKPAELILSAYPNPFNSVVEISIPKGFTASIYDVYGSKVHTLTTGSSIWNAVGQPSGVYLVRAQRGEEVAEKMVVLVR